MSNRRMQLSEEGKEILDLIADIMEIERPMAVKIALAKGIAMANGPISDEFQSGKKWTIPDNIIKDKEFLLYKHLIVSEINRPLNDDELHKHMLLFIEKGLRILRKFTKTKHQWKTLDW